MTDQVNENPAHNASLELPPVKQVIELKNDALRKVLDYFGASSHSLVKVCAEALSVQFASLELPEAHEKKGAVQSLHCVHGNVMDICDKCLGIPDANLEPVNSAPQKAVRAKPGDMVVAQINGKAAPWMLFKGKAGTREYAEQTAVWLSGACWPTDYVAYESAGWWYAEEAHSVSQRNDEQGQAPISPTPAPSAEHVKQMERELESKWMDMLAAEVKRHGGIPHLSKEELAFRESFAEHIDKLLSSQGVSSPASGASSETPVSSPVSSVERDAQKDFRGKEAG